MLRRVNEGSRLEFLPVIWFLRHGDAEQGEPDRDRPLTEKGERQARAAGRALDAIGVEFDLVLASPRVRARDTAMLACEEMGAEFTIEERLSGGDFDPHELATGLGEVLLVGHEPDFSNAIHALTGARADMKKGGLAAVEDGELRVLLRPRETKLIATVKGR
jgi:phosphohistidine phosphatase